MHEAAIAIEVIGQVLHHCDEHGARRVLSVELEIGELELIVPEALETAFAMAAEDTPAAGAELVMHEIAPHARCRQCGEGFTPEIARYVCPACQCADAEILAGKGIVLKSLELDS